MRLLNTCRNRDIFLAREAGMTLDQLAEFHGLACSTVIAIISAERNKLSVSTDDFYRKLRNEKATS